MTKRKTGKHFNSIYGPIFRILNLIYLVLCFQEPKLALKGSINICLFFKE